MATEAVLPIPNFLAYLVPLDVDVTGNITAKICEVWSEFNIFGAIFFLFIPNFKKLYSNVSCHIQICKQRY
jgi:hypothetical protein